MVRRRRACEEVSEGASLISWRQMRWGKDQRWRQARKEGNCEDGGGWCGWVDGKKVVMARWESR